MTGTGMNDGDNEWERVTQTLAHAQPPAEMTGVRMCE